MKNTKQITNVSNNLNSIIIGLILGDASLYKSSPTSNTRIEMSFGTNYTVFANHIGSIFKEYMTNPVKTVEIKGKKGIYLNYRLKTVSSPTFNIYHDMFYTLDINKGKWTKIVPSNIADFMDPIVLSYLIMSDGNFDAGRNRVRIYTNSFTKTEVEILASAINDRIGIYTGVLHDRKDQYILTIGARQLSLLREKCQTHFEQSMLYRIGL